MTPKATPHNQLTDWQQASLATGRFIAATRTVVCQAEKEEKGNTYGRQMGKDVKSLTILAQVQIKAVKDVMKVSKYLFELNWHPTDFFCHPAFFTTRLFLPPGFFYHPTLFATRLYLAPDFIWNLTDFNYFVFLGRISCSPCGRSFKTPKSLREHKGRCKVRADGLGAESASCRDPGMAAAQYDVYHEARDRSFLQSNLSLSPSNI